MMKKQKQYNELREMEVPVGLQPTFRGQASIVGNIRKRLRFLRMYNPNDNIPDLFVKESNKELLAAGISK